MLRKIFGFLLPALLIAPMSLSAQTATLTDVSRGVRPGDLVEIRVFTAAGDELVEVTGERIVDPDGQLYLPYIGTITVTGMTATALRTLLETSYSRLYDRPVVEVTSRLKVNVTGAVASPGHYLLDPASTIIDALSEAGGVGAEIAVGGYGAASDAENSRLVRNGELYTLDLRPETSDPTIFELPIQSGDCIHVPIARRSRTREQITFWSSVISLAVGTISLVYLVAK